MEKLFGQVKYFFDNTLNLNTQGQIIFSLIIILILALCILLFISYILNGIKEKREIKKLREDLKKEITKEQEEVAEIKENVKEEIKIDDNINEIDLALDNLEINLDNPKNEVEEIASLIKDAIENEKPVSLTNYEEFQEKDAVISIDELMQKAKELELIDDDEHTGVNYVEKYNLEPSEIEKVSSIIDKKEVKAFKVSQVISPIYGVKKEIIENSEN